MSTASRKKSQKKGSKKKQAKKANWKNREPSEPVWKIRPSNPVDGPDWGPADDDPSGAWSDKKPYDFNDFNQTFDFVDQPSKQEQEKPQQQQQQPQQQQTQKQQPQQQQQQQPQHQQQQQQRQEQEEQGGGDPFGDALAGLIKKAEDHRVHSRVNRVKDWLLQSRKKRADKVKQSEGAAERLITESRNFLLTSKHKHVEAREVLRGKVVGLYLIGSTHKLEVDKQVAAFYSLCKLKYGPAFEMVMVFVSPVKMDSDMELLFEDLLSLLPFYAVPFNDPVGEDLYDVFENLGSPALVILDADGIVINEHGLVLSPSQGSLQLNLSAEDFPFYPDFDKRVFDLFHKLDLKKDEVLTEDELSKCSESPEVVQYILQEVGDRRITLPVWQNFIIRSLMKQDQFKREHNEDPGDGVLGAEELLEQLSASFSNIPAPTRRAV